MHREASPRRDGCATWLEPWCLPPENPKNMNQNGLRKYGKRVGDEEPWLMLADGYGPGGAGVGTQGPAEKAMSAGQAAEWADEKNSEKSGFEKSAPPGSIDALTWTYGTVHWGSGPPF